MLMIFFNLYKFISRPKTFEYTKTKYFSIKYSYCEMSKVRDTCCALIFITLIFAHNTQ